ncbi:hypothetical protein BDW22DRAFT_1429702 [Trametopsis cervina]|nr:hypothetical protein BDW22DRAFT_1429702 [Trametopsis cervina]
MDDFLPSADSTSPGRMPNQPPAYSLFITEIPRITTPATPPPPPDPGMPELFWRPGVCRVNGRRVTTLLVKCFDGGERLPIYEVITAPPSRLRTGSLIQICDDQGALLEPPTTIQGQYASFTNQTGLWVADELLSPDSIFAIIVRDTWTLPWWSRLAKWATRKPTLDVRRLPKPSDID